MRFKEHSDKATALIIMFRHGLAKNRDEAERLCKAGHVYLNFRYPVTANTTFKPGQHILSVHKSPSVHADTYHTVTFRTRTETEERREERARYELMARIAQTADAEEEIAKKTDLQVADIIRLGVMSDVDATSPLFVLWEQVVKRLQRAAEGPMPVEES